MYNRCPEGKNKYGEKRRNKLHYCYYLQDELGSPLRVLYGNGNGDAYGYDEFGRDLYDPEQACGFKKRYSRQEEVQPFGYTGYCYDNVSGTYFAQEREYAPETGRFTAEDVLRGNETIPKTLNRYDYCWDNPINVIDRNGMDGYYFYDPDTFKNIDIEAVVASDKEYLESIYNTEIHEVKMDTVNNKDYTTFSEAWNAMDENIDVVVILAHANNDYFVSDSKMQDGERVTVSRVFREDIKKLDYKNIGTMYLFGCNMGLTPSKDFCRGKDEETKKMYKNSLASMFYAEEHRQNIGMIIASDGSIKHGIDKYGKRVLYAVQSNQYHTNGLFDGFKKYYIENGVCKVENIDDIKLYMGNISSRGYDEMGCEGKGNKNKYGEKKEKKK